MQVLVNANESSISLLACMSAAVVLSHSNSHGDCQAWHLRRMTNDGIQTIRKITYVLGLRVNLGFAQKCV